jgi:hypothetical protein
LENTVDQTVAELIGLVAGLLLLRLAFGWTSSQGRARARVNSYRRARRWGFIAVVVVTLVGYALHRLPQLTTGA